MRLCCLSVCLVLSRNDSEVIAAHGDDDDDEDDADEERGGGLYNAII